MSKHDEADLVLKLYELRRDATMRKARDWYFLEFNPENRADFDKAMLGEHSGHLRMVMSYWDMAAAMVNHGAISIELFNDTNGEHIGVFSKMEKLLNEVRPVYGPYMLVHLEKLIDDTPGGRQRVADTRERMKGIRAEFERARSSAAAS